jgi:hypothetical protein
MEGRAQSGWPSWARLPFFFEQSSIAFPFRHTEVFGFQVMVLYPLHMIESYSTYRRQEGTDKLPK